MQTTISPTTRTAVPIAAAAPCHTTGPLEAVGDSVVLTSSAVPVVGTVAPTAAPPDASPAPPAASVAPLSSGAAPATPRSAAAPVCLPATGTEPATEVHTARPLRLPDAALWSSLEASGWLQDAVADTPPGRPLTPPEKAGVLETVDRLREKGFVIYRDHGKETAVDLRPVDNAELETLIDGQTCPWKWKLSYASQSNPENYGFIHSLRKIPELAWFNGCTDAPHGLSEPAAASALRDLTSAGWTVRQCQGASFTSKPLAPERGYMILATREEQNYRNWYALQLEPPGGTPLLVHTAAEMALLGRGTPSAGLQLWQEHRGGAFPQAALDAASLLAPTDGLSDARTLVQAAETHLLPLVSSDRVPLIAGHHVLDAVKPSSGADARLQNLCRLLGAFPPGAGADGDVYGALDCWQAMLANAQKSADGANPAGARHFDAAARETPAGLLLQTQVDIAARFLPTVAEKERDAALVLALVDLPREAPASVEAAVRLLAARVPVDQVREALGGVEQIEEMSAAALPQPAYLDFVADCRTARELPLGQLPEADRMQVMRRLLGALAARGEAGQARRVYARIGATLREGRLHDGEVEPLLARFEDALSKGVGVQKALVAARPPRHAEPAAERQGISAAAAAAVPAELSADITRLAQSSEGSLPELASRMVAQGRTAEEKIAIGTAALEYLSRTAGCEEGAQLALDAIAAMDEKPAEKRAAAISDALPLVSAASGEELAALGEAIVKQTSFGARVRHVVLQALADDPVCGGSIRVGLEALGKFPKNLISFDSASAAILAGRNLRGGDEFAKLGQKVYFDIYRGMNTSEGWQAARAYVDALKGDPDVGTAMWLASEICGDESLKTSDHLQIYVAEAAFKHATATTGRDLATMCLASLDRVPEGSPRSAIRLAVPLLHALGRLYTDGPSRAAIDRTERAVAEAQGVSMIFGGNVEGDTAARALARQTLVTLQNTEDATTRLHRRMSEARQAAPVELGDDYVVVAGVRVPRKK